MYIRSPSIGFIESNCDTFLIGKDFKGGGHHHAIDDCNATKDIWQWMNKNPIITTIGGSV